MARGLTIGLWGRQAAVERPPPQLLQGTQGAAVEAEAAEGGAGCCHLSSTHHVWGLSVPHALLAHSCKTTHF
jgi:hypothetical protein